MRLWSLHPKYLDSKGLVALWREGLLAQAVLLNRTKGYRSHPQLQRFRAQLNPPASIGMYLQFVAAEAAERDYCFRVERIEQIAEEVPLIPVTAGQLEFERRHLAGKLQERDASRLNVLLVPEQLEPHPLFYTVSGTVEPWEKV